MTPSMSMVAGSSICAEVLFGLCIRKNMNPTGKLTVHIYRTFQSQNVFDSFWFTKMGTCIHTYCVVLTKMNNTKPQMQLRPAVSYKSLSAETGIISLNTDSDTLNEMPGQWWHKNDKTFKPVLRGHWQEKHLLEFHILIVHEIVSRLRGLFRGIWRRSAQDIAQLGKEQELESLMQTSRIKQDKIIYLWALWCLAFFFERTNEFTSASGRSNQLGTDSIIHLPF